RRVEVRPTLRTNRERAIITTRILAAHFLGNADGSALFVLLPTSRTNTPRGRSACIGAWKDTLWRTFYRVRPRGSLSKPSRSSIEPFLSRLFLNLGFTELPTLALPTTLWSIPPVTPSKVT